jgi:hypothetical protein
MMLDDFDWVCCDGGPHVFAPQDLAASWHATDAEYAAACAVNDVLGVIRVGSGFGLVLGDEVPMSAWVPAGAFSSGTLVVPMTFAEDLTADEFLAMVGRVPAAAYADTGLVLTSVADGFLLFAACDNGPKWIYSTAAVALPAGRYRIFTTEQRNRDFDLRLHALERCA